MEGVIYHETQVSRLCAVHCLNTLLQGPYFSEVELATVAQELDMREKEMMAEAGVDSAEFLKFMTEASNNVDADGNFSIQVLSKMLEVWGLQCIPIDSKDAGTAAMEPTEEHAFICNLQSHWFAVRRLDGEWYNLNSLFDAPEWLSPIYLSAFLGTLRMQGYSIFVVRGQLPPPMIPTAEMGSGSGRWLPRAVTRPQPAAARPPSGTTPAGAMGRDGKAAPSAWSGKSRSLREPAAGTETDGGSSATAGAGAATSGGAIAPGARALPPLDNDAELQAALDASLREFEAREQGEGTAGGTAKEPSADIPGVITLMVQGEGLHGVVRRISRRFLPDDPLERVVAFARTHGADMSRQALVVSYPRKVLHGAANLQKTLAELGIPDKSLLLLQPAP
eukprot:jgi/Mesvir1/18709/Mv12421-RA.1